MVKDGSCLERSLRRAKPATQQEAVCISGIFFCLEALDGAFGDFEAGFEDGFFIVAHEHLIFEEAGATSGARGVLLARPFHVLELVKEAGAMFQEVFEGYFVRGFATEEEFCEKIVFGEAFGNVFLQPAIKFGLARGCEVIDFAVGATFLDDDFGLDEFRVAEGFQGGVDLTVSGVPVAGEGAIEGLFDVVAAHGTCA